MVRTVVLSAVACAVVIASASDARGSDRGRRVRRSSLPTAVFRTGDRLLARLNWSPVPTPPALPTASLLGLASPRISSGVTSHQFGGLATRDGRLAGLGALSPRIAPAVVLLRFPPASRRERLLYGVAVLSPRAAVGIEIVKAARERSFARPPAS
jgi:hypothetical protein